MAQLSSSIDSEFWASFIGSKNLEADRPPEEDFDSISFSLQHLLPTENQVEVETIRKAEASITQRLVAEELQQFELSLLGENISNDAAVLVPENVSTRSSVVRAPMPTNIVNTTLNQQIQLSEIHGSKSQPIPSSPESPHTSIESSGYGSPASPPTPNTEEFAMKELLDRISWKTPAVDMKK